MLSTGPNTSRAQTFMSRVTSVRTVGRSRPSASTPPVASVAPWSTASSIQPLTRSVSPSLMSDATSVVSSRGSPTFNAATAGTSLSMNAS